MSKCGLKRGRFYRYVAIFARKAADNLETGTVRVLLAELSKSGSVYLPIYSGSDCSFRQRGMEGKGILCANKLDKMQA